MRANAIVTFRFGKRIFDGLTTVVVVVEISTVTSGEILVVVLESCSAARTSAAPDVRMIPTPTQAAAAVRIRWDNTIKTVPVGLSGTLAISYDEGLCVDVKLIDARLFVQLARSCGI